MVQGKGGGARAIGTIVSGSLTQGFVMRMSTEFFASPHGASLCRAGRFVSIHGNNGLTFFSLIADLSLESSIPEVAAFPPRSDEWLVREILEEQYLFVQAQLRPLLMLDQSGNRMPVTMIPSHFARVFEATDDEVGAIFGNPDDPTQPMFAIGTPLGMTCPVCINLQDLAERSTGIFGKTGTGKTFITRLVLAGLITYKRVVTIIFDMHSEYGLQARKEGGDSFVKGLKTLFPDRVAIFSLDPVSTRRRGGNPDAVITIPYSAIKVKDIVSLQQELNLHPTACEAAYLIAAKFGKQWLGQLLSCGGKLKELADDVGAHPESVAALFRKLKQIEQLPCFVPHDEGDNSVQLMMDTIERGISIVIEFGNFTSTFSYLLIANIITRRIHKLYMHRTEQFLGSRNPSDEPYHLVITIEEAHKFLNPQAAAQTIFGTIAREMRKYYVSLLVVDQRPSGIESEILSQIGTKIIAQLHDEKDIAAVLGGIHNAHQLKTVLASLESKRQALVLGHAVAMPIVIQTRSYDETFYKDMQKRVAGGALLTAQDVEDAVKLMY